MWGWQTEGGRRELGNSTYVVDNATLLASNAGPTTTIPATATILFSTSGLGSGTHTISITNVGVVLGIDHFIVQNSEGDIPTSTVSSFTTISTPTLLVSKTLTTGMHLRWREKFVSN